MNLKAAEREKATAGLDDDAAGASARERILDEAQRVFARFGYDGASMRRIAEAAGVPVALVSYHFGSKDGLYRAVFYRRVPAIVEQRLAGLAIAMSEPDLDRRLELVVKALVMPMLRLRARDKTRVWAGCSPTRASTPIPRCAASFGIWSIRSRTNYWPGFRRRFPTAGRKRSTGLISSCSAP